ncbi:DUF6531 domain-containing protein [Paraburkholderia phenoliruptrix]|uniref:DUF6531 domain-containing protein n=1 Tax=Paraburkholderia phenoliruptrix TaxID=252970 RepID=UPI00286986A7|nr:DUF6531 domain-containing protein [Paraburkholderia phenoliruptrix]WMY11379.1 DUF6531 domain-containing protein [Paraburkholderia phenoliruptrix]
MADPVFPGSGVVTTTENDFISGDDVPVTFTRTYRSAVSLKSTSAIGAMWFHNWQRQLNVTAAGSSGTITAYRANGESLTFSLANGIWRTKSFSGLTLDSSGSGWTVKDLVTETTESYSAQGVLLASLPRPASSGR